MKNYRIDYANLNNYSIADCGLFGKAMEAAITGRRCKSAGKVDWTHHRVRFEVKTGAGELGDANGARLLKGSAYVIYCPVPIADADGYIDLTKQEAFVLTREAFLASLAEAGAIREKTSTAGKRKVTIQTFWNRKQNKPHGALLYRLLDALYENCECTLEEMIEEEA